MRGAAAVVLALTLGACVSHPVGPARTFGKYEGKAVTTAESARSAVNNARLTARGAVRHRLFGAYVGTVIGEAEDAVSTASGTFLSIQPPDTRADTLRAELRSLLGDAEDHLSAMRIAARRGQIAELSDLAAPLVEDAAKLNTFIEDHS